MKIVRALLKVGFVIDFIDKDVKIREHCHTTGKHRGSAHRDCNINIKLIRKIPVVFHNLKIMILILLFKN